VGFIGALEQQADGHFSDFLPIAYGNTAVEHEKSNLDRKILGLSF